MHVYVEGQKQKSCQAMSVCVRVDVHVCVCVCACMYEPDKAGCQAMSMCVHVWTHVYVLGQAWYHAHRNPFPGYSKEMRSKIWVCWLSPFPPQTGTC